MWIHVRNVEIKGWIRLTITTLQTPLTMVTNYKPRCHIVVLSPSFLLYYCVLFIHMSMSCCFKYYFKPNRLFFNSCFFYLVSCVLLFFSLKHIELPLTTKLRCINKLCLTLSLTVIITEHVGSNVNTANSSKLNCVTTFALFAHAFEIPGNRNKTHTDWVMFRATSPDNFGAKNSGLHLTLG